MSSASPPGCLLKKNQTKPSSSLKRHPLDWTMVNTISSSSSKDPDYPKDIHAFITSYLSTKLSSNDATNPSVGKLLQVLQNSLSYMVSVYKEAKAKVDEFICPVCEHHYKNLAVLDHHFAKHHNEQLDAWKAIRTKSTQYKPELSMHHEFPITIPPRMPKREKHHKVEIDETPKPFKIDTDAVVSNVATHFIELGNRSAPTTSSSKHRSHSKERKSAPETPHETHHHPVQRPSSKEDERSENNLPLSKSRTDARFNHRPIPRPAEIKEEGSSEHAKHRSRPSTPGRKRFYSELNSDNPYPKEAQIKRKGSADHAKKATAEKRKTPETQTPKKPELPFIVKRNDVGIKNPVKIAFDEPTTVMAPIPIEILDTQEVQLEDEILIEENEIQMEENEDIEKDAFFVNEDEEQDDFVMKDEPATRPNELVISKEELDQLIEGVDEDEEMPESKPTRRRTKGSKSNIG